MVPVVTLAPNIMNISCWKIAPKSLVYIDPRILLNYYTFTFLQLLYLAKQFKIESSDIFQNFDVYFINRYLTVCFHKPIIWKNVRFFHSFVDCCIGTICHYKDFTGQVLLWKTLFHLETTYFTHKEDFFWQDTDPQMGPICSEWHS